MGLLDERQSDAHLEGIAAVSSKPNVGIYSDPKTAILVEREQSNFVCKIVQSESAESEQRLVKALKWLLEDSRRDDNREVA
jgi:hypothetical protein